VFKAGGDSAIEPPRPGGSRGNDGALSWRGAQTTRFPLTKPRHYFVCYAEAFVPTQKTAPIHRKNGLPYAARELHCCVATARKFIEQGLLRAYKAGAHWRVTDEQIIKCRERLEEIGGTGASS
jgi:hypothetical protein